MSKPLHLRQSAELLHNILAAGSADKQMESYFRANKNMGVRDRGAVAETVYGCLRERRVLAHVAPPGQAADLVAALFLMQGLSARALEEARYVGDARDIATRVRGLDRTALPPAVRANVPDWLWEMVASELGEVEALAAFAGLNQPAPVDLRTNTLKAGRDELRERLAAEGFATELAPFSPIALRRGERAPMFHTASFKQGLFEVQDEGSQLISFLVEPRRGEMVADFCAGAGGKTLHLGALMANAGTLYAFDVVPKRLAQLKLRAKRAGLDNVRVIAISNERDTRVQRLYGKMDRVLVDAPCSGTGTLRRNPDIKWREIDLVALVDEQKRILASAAKLVKPGGRLVYATCSILTAENEKVVADFLQTHTNFIALPVGTILAKRQIEIAAADALRLYPHRHQTDAFFAVALERRD